MLAVRRRRQAAVRLIQRSSFCILGTTTAATTSTSTSAAANEDHHLEGLDHLGLVARLRECWATKSLEDLKQIHDYIIKIDQHQNRHLANVLVVAYGKCSRIEEAKAVFDAILDPNVFSWTVLIAAFSQNGFHKESLQLFKRMNLEGVRPNQVTFITVLSACSAISDALDEGIRAHRCISGSRFEFFPVLQTALLNMYGKYGRVEEARTVFDAMIFRDVVAWSAILAATAQAGRSSEALKIYQRMNLDGVRPNEVTLIALAEACSGFLTSSERQLVEVHVAESGLEARTIVGNSLVNMFGRCGETTAAKLAFNRIREKDVVSWSVVISAFTQFAQFGEEGLLFFKQMLLEGVAPTNPTLVNCLDACSCLQKERDGRAVHSVIKSLGVESSPVVATALLNMYSRCKLLLEAEEIFAKISLGSRDVVAWTAMIGAYQQDLAGSNTTKILELFRSMDLNGVQPNEITTGTALLGCETLAQAKLLHQSIVGSEFESDPVLGTNLVSFYAKCGSLQEAKAVFDGMREKSLSAWNAMLSGGLGREGVLNLFRGMELEGVRGDEMTYIRILSVCMEEGSLAECRKIAARIAGEGLESTVLSNLLISVYGQCGSLAEASRIFEAMRARNLISWTAIIAAHAQHGDGEPALRFYQRMDQEGIKPDEITFISILFACSHSGMVREGRRYFLSMVGDHEMDCCIKHYDCLVDLLGRAGWLEEAEELAKAMPFEESLIAWTSLLAACKTHSDLERVERVGRRVAELDPETALHFLPYFEGLNYKQTF